MSLFDFNKLNRPSAKSAPTNPIELFRSAPALAETPNDLWQGQSKALERWHESRAKTDVLVSLHTGAGKTIVGLLIAQSLINEGKSRVLYVCATNDLVLQTSREIMAKLGFPHTTRMGGKFSNDLYETGRGFCLTNYQALFNSRTTFRGDRRPEAIIFDDAHVAEKIIRDSFTVRLDRDGFPQIYDRIVASLRPHFESIHRAEYFNNIVSGISVFPVCAAPPSAVIALYRDHSLLTALQDAEKINKDIGYALGHLTDHLDKCCLFVSKNSVEICPPFLPTKRIQFISDPAIRRVYLSATLTSEVDFCRAFGKRPAERIEPESDAGTGERLIILAPQDQLTKGGTPNVSAESIARVLSSHQKLLISTPSYASADKYKAIAKPPKAVEFSDRLEEFRRSPIPTAFVLVGRVDGIDLPHATCRVMLTDGLPKGFSLSELYLYDFLEMRNSFAAKLANRITQMFGRTNRGRNDYSVIFVTERSFANWLSTPRNIALLPELLRKQLFLGQSLVDQFGLKDLDSFPQLVRQVVERDPNWLAYYRDSISGLDVTEEQKAQSSDTDKLLTEAALAESEFAAQMWDGSSQRAREALGSVVDRVVVADRRLAGWYNIQIGHTLELEFDGESAAKQYSQARSRIQQVLALPIPSTSVSSSQAQQPKNLFHQRLLEIFVNDTRIQNDNISRYERLILPLFDGEATANQHEEALRTFGELLGYEASRPEQEKDNESTLDVLWYWPSTKEAILVELKTKKPEQGINKKDVGQGFNHLQSAANTLKDSKLLGLIFACPNESCTKDSAPSEQMWVSALDKFRRLYDEVVQTLLALQRLTPAERYIEIEAMSTRAEWLPAAIFLKLRGKRLLDART